MHTTINNKGFSFVEMMMAVAFTVLLMTGVYGFYNAAKQAYTSGVAGENLQDGANIVMSKIIEGESESGLVYRLSTSQSFAVACTSNCAPNPAVLYSCGGNPQNSPCNANNPYGELYFCQDNPATCNYNDAFARWYYLNSAGTSVIYHHPKPGGGTMEETIYTAPAGSLLTMRFSPAQQPNPAPPPATIAIPNVVEIDIGLRLNLSQPTIVTNNRSSTTSASGAATTFVLLRNHK